ncbi:hypothetical protein NFI96_021549, partial [Prochilodus magdalenae]
PTSNQNSTTKSWSSLTKNPNKKVNKPRNLSVAINTESMVTELINCSNNPTHRNLSSSATTPTNPSFDPCTKYSVVDDDWRDTGINYNYYRGHDDTVVEWKGWYRLYIEGKSAQIAETAWCERYRTCGGYTALWLGRSHPRLEDGIVTREIYKSAQYYYGYYDTQCSFTRSGSVQVKICPGDYYVYKLVKPDVSSPMPTYCAVVSNILSFDPCHNYLSLDQPWRANNETGLGICDSDFSWNGWYRLFYYGMNIRMAESYVDLNGCGTYYGLWLNGPHPEVEDGVVTRQVCANEASNSCYYTSTPIRVKACRGSYYVYEFVSPVWCPMAYCTGPVSTAATPTSYSSDPCNKYSVLDEDWRNARSASRRGHDDTLVEWSGWYRLYLQGKSAQISEWCVSFTTCGGHTQLWLSGSHPQLEDGIVTREIYGTNIDYNYDNQCSNRYRSRPIQVKACPGHYYVYKLVKPELSIPMPTYCTVVSNILTFDPCHNYVSLDQPWRANNETGLGICDRDFSWNGWYRLFYYGMNIRMPESYVDVNRCGTYYGLRLNGPHPEVEDGVVTRQVCANGGGNSCYFRSTPIRVKACPGSYYVYEFVSPAWCHMAYCTDVSTITPTSTSEFNITIIINILLKCYICYGPVSTPATPTSYSSDPCNKYSVLDEDWRNARSNRRRGHDDTVVEWSGWYRLYLQGKSAQISEWCASFTTCGGHTPLWLNGSHPQLEDGIVTRDVYGTNINYYNYYYYYYYYYHDDDDYYYNNYHNRCNNRYRSRPIQVKACPGHYYVYKLVKPELSIPMPTYCTVAFDSVADPCYNYVSLDQPWRANNESGLEISDRDFSWNGWYRLFYYGMNIRMSESCVPRFSCGAYFTMWVNGPHPEIEDGVVTRQVCGNDETGCCNIRFDPIRVKACPGSYYVYELVSQFFYKAAYCTDVNTLTPTAAPATTATDAGFNITRTTTPTKYSFDPCNNYTVLDDDWRNTSYNYWYWNPNSRGHDDTIVEWNGWYRLFFQGADAQILEGCVSYMQCGGYTSLWLGESHPQIEDGIVTREVYSSRIDESYRYQCKNYRKSSPIQVKACPEDYYVYKLVKPDVSLPMPTYCTVTSSKLSYDPCYNYEVLDDPQRATNQTNWNPWGWGRWCDTNMNWNGWYRLLYEGNNIRMPESCVSEVLLILICLITDADTITPVNDPEIPGTTDSTTTTSTTVTVDPCTEQSCTEDEWCGERDGVYGCFCNQSDPRPRDKSYDSRETCESSSGTMSLSRCQLFEAGFPTNVLHLSDPSCNGTLQNGRLVFHFDNDEHICGTNLTANGTHLIYENSIQGVADSAGGAINRKKELELRFSCVYKLRQTLTMDTEFSPLQSIVHKTLPDGQGMYQVRMIPYQDAAFSQPYNGTEDIEVDQRIFMEVTVQGVDGRQIATVIDSCWVTPVNDQNYAVRWDLIINQ